MRLLIICIVIALNGCAQLMQGQEQPVIAKKEGVYYTTCSGAVENFGTCNKKAIATCSKGYSVLDRFQDSNGTMRSLTFKCN